MQLIKCKVIILNMIKDKKIILILILTCTNVLVFVCMWIQAGDALNEQSMQDQDIIEEIGGKASACILNNQYIEQSERFAISQKIGDSLDKAVLYSKMESERSLTDTEKKDMLNSIVELKNDENNYCYDANGNKIPNTF